MRGLWIHRGDHLVPFVMAGKKKYQTDDDVDVDELFFPEKKSTKRKVVKRKLAKRRVDEAVDDFDDDESYDDLDDDF